jgi:ubiquinone/menaquinone biosynthesis C-methylase UbiE
VIALDVTPEMLAGARRWLAERDNIRYVQGSGSDLQGVNAASVDVVFSYIVLQHVPTVQAQLDYFREIRRVLRPGGMSAVQVRSTGVRVRMLDLAGPLWHRVQAGAPWRGSGAVPVCPGRLRWQPQVDRAVTAGMLAGRISGPFAR